VKWASYVAVSRTTLTARRFLGGGGGEGGGTETESYGMFSDPVCGEETSIFTLITSRKIPRTNCFSLSHLKLLTLKLMKSGRECEDTIFELFTCGL
jgi:hypothetical protein